MSVFVCCEARREAPVPKSHDSVLLIHRLVFNKVNFFLISVSDKCHFCVRMFRTYVSMYLGDDGAKELVIICDFSRKNERTQNCFLSLKGVEL